jgi:hypothetical protein
MAYQNDDYVHLLHALLTSQPGEYPRSQPGEGTASVTS